MGYRYKKQSFSRGLISFCQIKKINPIKIAVLFATHCNFQGTDIDLHIQQNWKKFAGFVNKGILDGSIIGENVSASNGSGEQADANRRAYAQFPQELRDWWSVVKSKADWCTGQQQLFQKFFHQHNLGLIPKKNDCELNIGRCIPIYEVIKASGKLEEFKTFTI